MEAWWKEQAVYQIYPMSFCDSNGDGMGDIPGIISKLPYIRSLGVGILWLSPVYRSPGEDNGYDISDYCDIDPKFGTLADMDELIQKANALGLKIVMDGLNGIAYPDDKQITDAHVKKRYSSEPRVEVVLMEVAE